MKLKRRESNWEGQKMVYDLIGDISGDHDGLKKTLDLLGYKKNDGKWTKPSNDKKLIFIGQNFSNSKENLKIFKELKQLECDIDSTIIMSEFDYNLLGHMKTIYEDHFEELKEKEYQNAYLNFTENQALDLDEISEIISWLRKRPIFFKEKDLLAAHACWHQDAVYQIENFLDEKRAVKKGFMDIFYDQISPAKTAIKKFLSGEGLFYNNDDYSDTSPELTFVFSKKNTNFKKNKNICLTLENNAEFKIKTYQHHSNG